MYHFRQPVRYALYNRTVQSYPLGHRTIGSRALQAAEEMAFLLEDDAEAALEAALSFLGTVEDESVLWGLGSSDLSQPLALLDHHSLHHNLHHHHHAPPSLAMPAAAPPPLMTYLPPPPVPAPKKAKSGGYNSNRARDERKEELIYLRKTVQDMETCLVQLKAAKARGLSSSSANSTASSLPSVLREGVVSLRTPVPTYGLPVSSSVWQDMAVRQGVERRKAEQENVRLHVLLEAQIKMAKSLEKMLQKQTNARMLATIQGNPNRVKCDLPLGSRDKHDEAILAGLLAGMDETMLEVDSVFDANGLGRIQTSHHDAQIRHDSVHGMVLEIFASKLMPFDLDMTGMAAWRHAVETMERLPSRWYYEKQSKQVENSVDTIAEVFSLEVQENRTRAHFHVRQILRKRVEQERVVIAWRAHSDQLELGVEALPGIEFIEKGYTVIKRPDGMPSNYTLVQTCYILKPQTQAEIPDQDRKLAALADFLIHSVTLNISASHQLVENFLFDQALRKKAHSMAAEPQAAPISSS